MQDVMNFRICAAWILLTTLFGGCSATTAEVGNGKDPVFENGRFVDAKHRFSVAYPKDWKAAKCDSAEDVLTLQKAQSKGEISIAVPSLPPHIPGMIPLGSVESGYVDDVKKRMKNVKEIETNAVRLDGIAARRFVITGQDKSGKRKLVVLAMMKGDRLFVMTGEGPENEFAAVETGFEQVERSWKWKQ